MSLVEKAADLAFALRRYPPSSAHAAPKVIAHRGAWDYTACFENTMRSFTKARELGAYGIEFDVHFTADLVPVVHHDPKLERMFKHPGVLKSMTLKNIRSVTPDVPTLDEVLALKGLHFMIEIKVEMDDAKLAALNSCLEKFEPLRDYHLLTVKPAIVREGRKTPAAAWILVGQLNLSPLVKLSLAKGYGGVAGHYLGLSEAHIAQLHEQKQIAGVGFTPTKNLFNRERARGIDFVFTNSTCRLF